MSDATAIARRLARGENEREIREELIEAFAGRGADTPPLILAERLLREASILRREWREVRKSPRGWHVVQKDHDGMVIAASAPIVRMPSSMQARYASARDLHVTDIDQLQRWGFR